ncbi:MAG: hypothetical protein IT454_14225 [Planctomycetes bacterium]|nr:hypothetical protein [Planctomycetota bacterium]
MLTNTLLVGAACASLIAGRARAQDTWVALGVPSLCQAPAGVARIERLERGAHLVFENERREVLERPSAASLPLSSLLAALQDDAARRRIALKLLPSAPPILARGDAAAVESVRAALNDLEQFGRALEVELRVVWLPGRADLGTHPANSVLQGALATAEVVGTALLRSGERAELGVRRSQPFLASYSIELATNSGVAEPSIGAILSGRTVHVRAARVRAGQALHIEGFLDVARLLEVGAFDPGTKDLGERLDAPQVDALQVAFSGVVESGGWLALSVEGIPWCAGTLCVQATTRPDPQNPVQWRGFDVALLETRVDELPPVEPQSHGDDGVEPRSLRQPLSSAELAQLGDEQARGAKNGVRPAALWAPGCLISSVADSAGNLEIEAVIRAAERERTREHDVLVECAGIKVRLPATEGGVVRVLAARESTRLVDYDAVVAQEIWMPEPRVLRVLDGFDVEGLLEGEALRATAWSTSSGPLRPVSRGESGVGALTLSERSLRSGAARVSAGVRREILSPLDQQPALAVSLERAR